MTELENFQPIPLAELLAAIQGSQVEWLSGADLAHKTTIDWVSTELESAGPADLVLLPLESASPLRNFECASNSNVAAIGWIGSGPLPVFDFPIHKPVFRIPLPDGVRIVSQRLLTYMLSPRSILIEQGAQIQSRLTQIAARAEGLTGLVAALREITQHSILVQDKRLAPLASSPTAGLRPVWEDLLDALSDFSQLPEMLRDRRQAGELTALSQQPLPGGLERLVIPIVAGDMARGYLSILAQTGELDATDRMAAEQGALVCAVDMARAKAVRETEKRLHGDLLAALLNQNLAPRDAQLWAQNIGLDLGQHHAAIRLTWEEPSPSIRRLETVVNGEVARGRFQGIVSQMGNEVICFCPLPTGLNRPEAALALAEAAVRRAGLEFPAAVARCGVGTPAKSLADWQVSFRCAGQALDMARRLDERAPLYYMDLSVYRLLLQIEDHPDLRSFLHETLGPVLAHENAPEFLLTLEHFFAHNGNLSQTAEALAVHRNTLIYRIERMAALAKIDLDNPETRLAIQLALRIRRMLEVSAG